MQDNMNWIILGGCGFALLFMLFGIFAYKQFRRLIGKFFIIGIVNKIIGDTENDIKTVGDDEAYRRPHAHPTEADLRAKAADFDFDAALAQQAAVQSASQSAPPPATQSAPQVPAQTAPPTVTAQTTTESASQPQANEPHLRQRDIDEPADDIYDDDDDDND